MLWMPTVMMMGKSASQPIWVSNGGSRAYLLNFMLVACMWKRSLRYVNLNVWIFRFALGEKKDLVAGGVSSTHSMLGLRWAGHLHLGR